MKMQTAITTKQAREICKGRTPLIPVEYETAVKALAECVTLDEAKYWDNKADALAAWAKIYHSSEAERKAKQLKLHAYRRMGQLAGELRPRNAKHPGAKTPPGAVALLCESGLSRAKAEAARSFALMPRDRFNAEISRPRPISPGSIRNVIARGNTPYTALMTCRSHIKKHDPVESARVAAEAEQMGLIACVRELIDWLDAFEQALPRAKP